MALNAMKVTFDYSDPATLAGRWAEFADEFTAMTLPEGARFGFPGLPDPTPGKNRVHLDFGAVDVDAEALRPAAAGASEVGRHTFGDNFRWVVLAERGGTCSAWWGSGLHESKER
jgi:hypothetical protein